MLWHIPLHYQRQNCHQSLKACVPVITKKIKRQWFTVQHNCITIIPEVIRDQEMSLKFMLKEHNKIVELHKFLKTERLDSYFDNWKCWKVLNFIIFSMVLCDIFSKNTKLTNHITDWFHVHFFLVLVKTSQWWKGPSSTTHYQMSATYSPPLAINPPENLTTGGPFWCSYKNVEI